MCEPVRDVKPFALVGDGQVVQADARRIPLLDERTQFIGVAEPVVGGAFLGQVGLASELESLDAIAAPVGEDEEPLMHEVSHLERTSSVTVV